MPRAREVYFKPFNQTARMRWLNYTAVSSRTNELETLYGLALFLLRFNSEANLAVAISRAHARVCLPECVLCARARDAGWALRSRKKILLTLSALSAALTRAYPVIASRAEIRRGSRRKKSAGSFTRATPQRPRYTVGSYAPYRSRRKIEIWCKALTLLH